MRLIKQTNIYHVSLETVEEFENEILSNPHISFVNQRNKLFSKILFLAWKLFNSYLKTNKNEDIQAKLVNGEPFFTVLMGPDFSKCLPYFLSTAQKNVYIFDAWPSSHESIIQFANSFKVDNLFVSSFQASEAIQSKVKKTKCYWVAEGINPEPYKYYSYENKSIDVLALGRKYDVYHKIIEPYLYKNDKKYLYVKNEGKIIFPTKESLIDGLAKSKISICVPSSITHPNRSGNIETMTVRYLQSMISKCIVVGHAPKEMITLFGYNPVIEIDINNPEQQIQSILDNYLDYIPLIEKNYTTVKQKHTWKNRWREIKTHLN